ncbi:hypothetical protein F4821DRAFT_277967 [Hypoxylon rubiginosum]|uniref:Uncharacterized protein n=1 Tax=Hypoxylon rubiginosum TaxID=110542 RepID=A0ACC0DJC9_9PEZI|nr:hypothetical protein F4821DRAFT_277967 [Hypoxylon rubiginosum]
MAAPHAWAAPWPFSAYAPTYETGHNFAEISHSQFNRMLSMLQKLCELGGSPMSGARLIKDTELYEGLNAFNLNALGNDNGCWAFISPYVLKVPTAPYDDIDWATWEHDNRVNSYHGTPLLSDLNQNWIPVTANPFRQGNQPRYRFIIWMHKHSGTETNDFSRANAQSVYSCTVYDRENQRATWYDCWHDDQAQRLTDITNFWLNINLLGWPAPIINALSVYPFEQIKGLCLVGLGEMQLPEIT